MIPMLLLLSASAQEDSHDDELQQLAEMNFSTVMSRNAAPAESAPRPAMATAPAYAPAGSDAGVAGVGPEVVVPLSRYEALIDAPRPPVHTGPLVVLGGSRYTGSLQDGALSVTLELTATLSG